MEAPGGSSASNSEPVGSGNDENELKSQSPSISTLTSVSKLSGTPCISPLSPDISSSHQCGLCGDSFSLLTLYLAHRVLQHAGQQRGMNCELCGTAYSRQTTLREHYKKKHKISFSNKLTDTSSQAKPSQTTTTVTAQPTKRRTISNDENQEVKGNNTATKTIHVIITKTEEEEGDTTTDIVRKGEENMTEGDSNDHPCQFEIDGHETGDMDKLTTEINDVNNELTQTGLENMDIDRTLEMIGENINMDLGPEPCASGSSPKKVSESGISGSVHSFDDSEDFHFVLLKNMINGNSFKYSKDRFKCLHCEFKSYWRNSMCSHMKEHHKDMMSIHQFIEIKPPETEGTQSDQTIIKMSDYIMSLHQKKTKSAQYRIRNVEKQDLPGHFPCSKCDKVFNRLRYLRKHMLVHRTDKKYLCDECGKAFKTRSYLKTHNRTHKVRLFKCSQCNFSSSVNAVIHAHRQLHNDSSVICDVCGFAYADKSTLKKHMLVHDPDRPFPCTFPGCTWRFKTKVMCLAHYNAHTTEGKFRCSVCGYVFRHKHHLQRHQGKMHGISNTTNVTIVEDEKKEVKDNEVSDVPDTVNLIVNSDFSRDQLQSALQNGQLVIATDSEGNTINYEVADITMNVTYHTLLEDESELGDTQTILHVATIDSQEDTL